MIPGQAVSDKLSTIANESEQARNLTHPLCVIKGI